MAMDVRRLNDAPIVVFTVVPPLQIPDDPITASQEFARLTADVQGKRVRILDFSDVDVNFGDVVMGLQADTGAKLPNTSTFFVGKDELVALAATAFASKQYGSLNAKAFTSIDDAIAAARAEING
ncbi:MAG: hypothetical protein K8S97_01100 [Anaerolineae bacterium]|nr:hypothetical protein [Anaerolineae bacterium]